MSNLSQQKVAFVGLGVMGFPMAGHLQQKGEQFARQSQQSLLQLLSPLQADMKGFRDKVESIHTEDLKQRSELKTELLNLQKLNSAITDQAARLTNALQGQKKLQGNWGELMLENVKRLTDRHLVLFATFEDEALSTMADAAPLCDTAVDPPRCRKELDRLVDEFLSLAEKDGD